MGAITSRIVGYTEVIASVGSGYRTSVSRYRQPHQSTGSRSLRILLDDTSSVLILPQPDEL